MSSEIELEKQKTLEALKEFRKELLSGKHDILSEVKVSKEEVEDVVKNILPKDHDEHHAEIRRFMDHAPDAKSHGVHHEFTESVRAKIEHMIVAIFKGLGGIILISLAIGLYSWFKHNAG